MKSAKRYYKSRAAEMRAKANAYIEAAQIYDRMAQVQALTEGGREQPAENDSLH